MTVRHSFTAYILRQKCSGIYLIDLPVEQNENFEEIGPETTKQPNFRRQFSEEFKPEITMKLNYNQQYSEQTKLDSTKEPRARRQPLEEQETTIDQPIYLQHNLEELQTTIPPNKHRIEESKHETTEKTNYHQQSAGHRQLLEEYITKFTVQPRNRRMYPPVRKYHKSRQVILRRNRESEDKDLNIKDKIATLVLQTVHDTEVKVKSIRGLKAKNREHAPYKIGFILSMIKKARDVLNELFNVAVKHRDEWKALEQLKIFELIVHTNVDTTNLVRQLVEIHIQHMNATGTSDRKRIVLI